MPSFLTLIGIDANGTDAVVTVVMDRLALLNATNALGRIPPLFRNDVATNWATGHLSKSFAGGSVYLLWFPR